MKKLTLSLATIFLISLGAMAATPIDNVASFLNKTFEKLTEEGGDELFLLLSMDLSDIQQSIETTACANPNNFRHASPEEVTLTIERDVLSAYERIHGKDSDYAKLAQALGDVLKNFSKEASSHVLDLCIDATTPAFSDGHRSVFIRIDGSTVLGYEVGFPD